MAHQQTSFQARKYEYPQEIQVSDRQVSFEAYGVKFEVKLEAVTDLVQGHVHITDGKSKVQREQLTHEGLYRGTVYTQGMQIGSARLTVDDIQFTGILVLEDETFHIVNTTMFNMVKHDDEISANESYPLIIFKESQRDSHMSCAADTSTYKPPLTSSPRGLVKRAVTDKCLSTPMTMYVAVVADCSYFSVYGDVQTVLKQILADFSQASHVYESTFNIQLGVQSVEIRTQCGGTNWNVACSNSYRIDRRLSDFSQWRGTQQTKTPLYHLLTRCGSGQVMGIAWLGAACKTDASMKDGTYTSGTAVSSSSWFEWSTITHEISHNFNAVHDCSSGCSGCANGDFGYCNCGSYSNCPCCPCEGNCDCQGAYIMSATSAGGVSQFSPCTINQICSAKGSWGTCLKPVGTLAVVQADQCGNGIKESSEECDCGGVGNPSCVSNPCCDAATCKLKSGAKCSDSNDLCCNGCQIITNGTVCRASRGSCDLPEVCPGNTGDCPNDAVIDNLTPCQIDGTDQQGRCASGDCTSRAYQCQNKGISGVTGECPGYSNQCQMYCVSSQQIGACVAIGGGFFEDGSPCGYSGQCYHGACAESGVSQFFGFIQAHSGSFIIVFSILVSYIIGVLYSNYVKWSVRKAGPITLSQLSLKRPLMASQVQLNTPVDTQMQKKKTSSLRLTTSSPISPDGMNLASARLNSALFSPSSPLGQLRSRRKDQEAQPLSPNLAPDANEEDNVE